MEKLILKEEMEEKETQWGFYTLCILQTIRFPGMLVKGSIIGELADETH